MVSNNELVQRSGPTVQQYLVDLILFFKQRTGFRHQHFFCTAELKCTLKNLEFYKLPMELWRAFLNGTTRLIASCSQGTQLTIKNFIEIFMQIFTIVIDFAMEYFLLKATLYIISLLSPTYLRVIITGLYHLLVWAGRKIWELASPRIESYTVFALKKLTPNSQLAIDESADNHLQISEIEQE